MKSGVAAIVAAALQLSRARLRGPGMAVVLVAGEETAAREPRTWRALRAPWPRRRAGRRGADRQPAVIGHKGRSGCALASAA